MVLLAGATAYGMDKDLSPSTPTITGSLKRMSFISVCDLTFNQERLALISWPFLAFPVFF